MTQEYFGPLKDRGFGIEEFDYDKFKQWIESQPLNFKKGLTIRGDLLVGDDTTYIHIRNDTVPLSGSVDAENYIQFGDWTRAFAGYIAADLNGAVTTGYEAIFYGGPHAGSSITGGPYVSVGSTAGGNIINIKAAQINLFNGTLAGNYSISVTPGTSLVVYGPNIDLGGADSHVVRARDGSISAPSYTFQNGTGAGMYRTSSGNPALVSGGSEILVASSGGDIFLTNHTTTGSATNAVINSSTGRVQRSTSALKYKSDIEVADYLADIELVPTKHWRKDDKTYKYGLIADWLGEQDELLGEWNNGEVENYDLRAVVAVLAAKNNRLEKRIKELEKVKNDDS